MRNRVIRTDDPLWADVKTEAARRGESVAAFVRETLGEAVSPRPCFACGAPSGVLNRVGFGPTVDDGDVSIDDIRNGTDWVDRYTPVALTIYSCEPCSVSVGDYLMDTVGVSMPHFITPLIDKTWGFGDSLSRMIDEDGPAYSRLRQVAAEFAARLCLPSVDAEEPRASCEHSGKHEPA